MKSLFTSVLLAVPVFAFAGHSIDNGDFEQVDAAGKAVGWSLPPQFKVDRTGGSNGSGGLVFENADPSYRQSAAIQRLDVKPGDVFELGGWVNVERLEKGGGGCMFVCIWCDKDGKYVGETQTEALRSKTSGWVKLHALTRALPKNAASGSFGFYSRGGNVGRIAVDKVYCRPYLRKAVAGVYSNAYRDEVTDGPVTVAAALTPASFGVPAKDVTARFRVVRPDGTVLDVESLRPADDQARTQIDAAQFGFGTNRVVCTLRAGDKIVDEGEMMLVRNRVSTSRKVRIDRFGRTVVDGKLFFPIGAMAGCDCNPKAIAKYVDSDFNCVMTYGRQSRAVLDAFDKADVKVIYYLADHWEFPDKGTNYVRQTIAEFKDHPAVMGWYLYDERPTSEMPMLAGRHNLVVSLDADHPTWVAQDLPAEARHYMGAFDVFGGDAYPIPYRDVSSVAEYMREQSEGLMGVRAAWQVPQFISWRWYRDDDALRCPTAAEIRNMTWQEIAAGARGIVGFAVNDVGPWSLHLKDLSECDRVWEELKKIATELRSYEHALLLAVTKEIPAAELPSGVIGRTFEENGERWKLLVNTTYEKRGDLEPLGVSFEKTGSALTVDFDKEIAPVRPELHSAGFGPQICSCPQQYIDDIKSMGFTAARTHDWALINPGQRVCDYLHIFPLMHLDAKDPKNYVFGPTDYLLKRTREETKLDVFFRLGTSIEHSGNKVHFNAAIPEDFDKVAEVFAGTVRHYNCGWANGFNWGIKYWEIWNEPNGTANMWCLPEGDETEDGDSAENERRYAKRRALFATFYAKCLKRLKSEFPDIKVGGPALCWMEGTYFRAIFDACKAEGVKPDFISWHHYIEDPQIIFDAIAEARALCDEYGFSDCELIINEWHYFGNSIYSWADLRSPDPEKISKVWEGPHGHNGIDSSCFNLTVLSHFQTSKLDQGYYYGCRNTGAWGYMDEHKRKYKVYYGLKIFGEFIRDHATLCAAAGENPEKEPVVTVLAAKSADGKKRSILVSDYRGGARELVADVKGVPTGAKVTAHVHDHGRDFAPVDVTFQDGRLTLVKADVGSAAFLVEFE